jgi:hypothetical protein
MLAQLLSLIYREFNFPPNNMKAILLIATLFFSVNAIGATRDTVTHKGAQEPPVRYFYRDGSKMPPQDIPIIHEMDCTPYGWRWDTIEWEQMKSGRILVPHYDTDPIHGSNGGVDWA